MKLMGDCPFDRILPSSSGITSMAPPNLQKVNRTEDSVSSNSYLLPDLGRMTLPSLSTNIFCLINDTNFMTKAVDSTNTRDASKSSLSNPISYKAMFGALVQLEQIFHPRCCLEMRGVEGAMSGRDA